MGPVEYLRLFGTDGNMWKTRVHAEYRGATHTIKLWFESKDMVTENGENDTMEIVAWDGKTKWHVELPAEVVSDQPIHFTLTPSKAK